MKHHKHALSHLLKSGKFPKLDDKEGTEELEKLQLKMLRAQQGIYHGKQRALILFEGFDAAGKGGAIRRLVEPLDPRGIHAVAFGPPSETEQGRHYLYRFWKELPRPGQISVFDRTWYGRVLVERVEKLTPKERWQQAYAEIRQHEKLLIDDGIDIVKIFLAITPEEQLKRFKQRIEDPYKQWKITPADIEARAKWGDYVEASDEMFKETHTEECPWHIVPANDKDFARARCLEIVTKALGRHIKWIEQQASSHESDKLKKALQKVEKARKR
jgi:polyphosphate kinase 2 (PPK2 family)